MMLMALSNVPSQGHASYFFSMYISIGCEESILGSQNQNSFGQGSTLYVMQSYEIKSPPWTILQFRILGIFSVENIAKLGVFMFQTSDNSQLCIDSQYSSQQLTIVSSLKHKNTQPLYIFNRENLQNSEPKMVQGGELISQLCILPIIKLDLN